MYSSYKSGIFTINTYTSTDVNLKNCILYKPTIDGLRSRSRDICIWLFKI